jgi:iron(III) transport system permease protein
MNGIKSSKTELFIAGFFLLVILLPLLAILLNIPGQVFNFDFSAFAALSDTRILNLFGRSLLLSFCVVMFSAILAFPFAFVFSHYDFRWKGTLFISTLIPLLIPAYISAISWQYALGSDGWLTSFLHVTKSSQFISGFGGSLFVLSFWLFPLMMLFLYNAFRIGKPYREVAVLYRSFWPRLKFITSLMARHGILSGAMLTFVLAFTNFSVPGALQLNVFPTEIFAQFGAFYKPDQAAVLSVPNVIIALILAFWISNQFRQQKKFAQVESNQSPESLKGWKAAGIIGLLALVLTVIIIVPIATLIERTGSAGLFFDAFVSTLTQWTNTFFLALTGSLIICFIAFFMALYSRNKPRAERLFMALLLLPLFISGGLYAIGMIEIWNQPVFGGLIYGSPAMLVLSYFRFIPIGYYLIAASMVKLPGQFEEIGQLSGRKKSAIVLRIVLPLIKPGILGALFLTFIFCFSELDTAVLTYPPGMETIPVRIFALLHYGTHQTVAALCLWQILIIIVLVLMFLRWKGRWENGTPNFGVE